MGERDDSFHHRLVGHLDLVLLDIQIKRRDENLAGLELERVGEKVAAALVLQLVRRDDYRLALDVINADDLHAGFVEPAQLVVDALAAGKVGKVMRQVRQVCRQDVRLEHVDVDADADGLAGADGAHGGYSRPPVVEDLPTANLSK